MPYLTPFVPQMATQEQTYTKQDIFWILGQALILLADKQITVIETDRYEEDGKENERRVSLVDYIVRAVADELLEHFGENQEDVRKAIEDTKMDFDEITYPDENKCIGIFNDIR